MTRTEKLAANLLKPINPSLIVVFGFYTIVWGLWIFSPFWTVFTQAPLYAIMASISTEFIWGAIAVICGLFITRGAFKPSRSNIRTGSFIGAIFWLIIALLYFAGDWTSTGGITSLTFAIYSGLIWLNVTVNPEFYPDKIP